MSRKMTRRSFATLAVAVPGVAILSACTPGEPAPPSPTANVAFTQRQTGGAGAAGTAAPAGAGGDAGSATTVEIGEYDLYFEPANVTIPADTDVQVKVSNNGALEHNWDVLGTSFMTQIAGSGDVQTISVNLPAGTYDLQCDVPGHAAAGMVGVLTVEVGGGAAPAAAAAQSSFDVSEVDLAFEPADFTIPADTDVQVTVTNNGALDHNWDVLGTSFMTQIAGGGDVQTITVNLPAGEYDLQCDVPGHAAAGMVGKLTVAAGGATTGTASTGTPESGATPVAGTPEGGTPVATGGTPAAPAAAAGSTAVSIGEYDLYFEPADVTIPANTDVMVTVMNNGFAEHNWDVLGTSFKTQIAGNGAVETITVNLAAGSYDIQCDVPGHAQAGMIGVLTVQ